MLPEGLSSRWIRAKDIGLAIWFSALMDGLVALQDLDVKFAFKDQRACGVGPLVCKCAEVLLQIPAPLQFSVQVKCGDHAVSIKKYHARAISCR